MSVLVCRVMPTFDVVLPNRRMPMPPPAPVPARQLDIWNAILVDNEKPPPAKPYAQPLLRRTMTHKSLELCTESLGSETGSRDDFLDETMPWLHAPPMASPEETELPHDPALMEPHGKGQLGLGETSCKEQLTAVRYHYSRAQRAFPPPLPSMSRRRDGPCLRMRPHRRDGRLVMEAVPVRPHGYLHTQRQGGRLRLCFVDYSAREQSCMVQEAEHGQDSAQELEAVETQQDQQEEEEEEEEIVDEEEEVEVVDRGTVVEVKVSTQASQVAASGKVQRSRLVINKFVGGTPVSDHHQPARCDVAAQDEDEEEAAPAAPAGGLRRVPSSTTTLAAAVAVASTDMKSDEEEEEEEAGVETRLLFTSRVGDTRELVQSVRQCRQLRQKALFIVEPYCIAIAPLLI